MQQIKNKKQQENYECYVNKVKQALIFMVELGDHPTKFLVDVIEATYGHKVDLSKLIELIETSPLASDEKNQKVKK